MQHSAAQRGVKVIGNLNDFKDKQQQFINLNSLNLLFPLMFRAGQKASDHIDPGAIDIKEASRFLGLFI